MTKQKNVVLWALLVTAFAAINHAVADPDSNFNLYITNTDPNYDTFISGNDHNRQDIIWAPEFSNSPIRMSGGRVAGPFRFDSGDAGWANYAFNPFCGNEHANNVGRITFRANQNGYCNPPANGYAKLMPSRGVNTCVEVTDLKGATIAAITPGTELDGTPTITLNFQYNPGFTPRKYLPTELCTPDSDFCIVFKNKGSNDFFVDSSGYYNFGQGPVYTHKKLIPPGGTIAANHRWQSTHIGQGGSGTFELRNSCDGAVTDNLNVLFPAAGMSCPAGSTTFQVRNVFTKAGSWTTGCVNQLGGKVTVDPNGWGTNKPIITVTLK